MRNVQWKFGPFYLFVLIRNARVGGGKLCVVNDVTNYFKFVVKEQKSNFATVSQFFCAKSPQYVTFQNLFNPIFVHYLDWLRMEPKV